MNLREIYYSHCQLQIHTCHVPLLELKLELLQLLLTFDNPLEEFRVENRNEALCTLDKTGRTGLQLEIIPE